jgi:type VI secretion system protein ImpJ
MEYSQKVLWHEGMLLTPQHFQQWDRHQDQRLGQLAETAQAYSYGLTALQIDARALASREFALLSASGAFPDGLVFDLSDANELPAARPVGANAFDTSRDRCGVYLAAPISRPGAIACSDTGQVDGHHTRFKRRLRQAPDENPGGNPREIAIATKNLRVLFEGEALDGHSTIKIAELARSPAGGLELSETYVPPCLHLSASPTLVSCLRRIAEILVARSTEMAQMRRSRTQGLVEFSVSEVANFVMLHTVNGHLPVLLHQLAKGRVHPEAVFLQLAALAGQLCAFADEGHPKDLPAYHHDEPAGSFMRLEERLRGLLGTVIPTRYVPITLKQVRDLVQSGAIPEGIGDSARIYLSVLSSLPSERVMREVPLKAKIASSGRIDALIANAMSGLKLTYLSVPPSEIPAQPGGTYFELTRGGDEWTAVAKTRSLSIYLPREYSDARIEFLAVKE